MTGINLPSVPDLGTWTIDFQVNESTLIADSFDVALPADCDFTGDMVCDVADIDMMYAQGNLVEDVVADAGNAFDLDGDLDIDNTDLGQWLADAAVENGFTSPFVREDTDDVGPFALRDVDITDFNSVSSNFDAAGNNVPNNTWNLGDFDGDITDFNFLAGNFAAAGYAATVNVVPEPSTVALFVAGLLSVLITDRGSVVRSQ